MAKKKKNNSNQNSESEIYIASACTHIKSAIEANKVNKTLKQKSYSCEDCDRENTPFNGADSLPTTESAEQNEAGGEVSQSENDSRWICLKCGRVLCGRSSVNQHGLKHFATPRSDSHCLTYCPQSGMLWCYSCDDEVNPEQSVPLNKLVNDVLKWYQTFHSTERQHNGNPLRNENGNVSVSANQIALINSSRHNQYDSSKMLTMHGLVNLGNTCYFNSVVQCLVRTPCIAAKLSECLSPDRSIHLEVPMEKELENNGYDEESEEGEEGTDHCTLQLNDSDLCSTSLAFLQVHSKLMDFSSDSDSSSSTNQKHQKCIPVNPQNLRQCLGRINHRFGGYTQQDSHELLRALLDSIKQEEVRRFQKSILEKFKLKKSIDPKSVPDHLKQKIRHYGQYVQNSSCVDRLFGGCLLSTVTCETCSLPSLKFEHFLDLSLAIEHTNRGRNSATSCVSQGNNHCGLGKKREKSSDEEEVASGSQPVSKYKAKKAKQLSKKEKRKNKGKRGSELEKGILEGDIPENKDKENDESMTLPWDSLRLPSINEKIREKLLKSPRRSISLQNLRNFRCFNSTNECVDLDSLDLSSMARKSSSMSILYDDSSTRSDDQLASNSSDFQTVSANLKPSDRSTISDLSFVDALDTTSSDICQQTATDSKEQSDDLIAAISGDNDIDKNVENLPTELSAMNLSNPNNFNNCDSGESTKHSELPTCLTSNKAAENANCSLNGNKSMLNGNALDADFNRDAKKAALETLRPFDNCRVLTGLEQCLHDFIQPDLLCGSNKILCENCSKLNKKCNDSSISEDKNESRAYRDAQKRYLLYSPPPILTIHLKRFHQIGRSLQKINKHVSFPLKLDASPFFSKLAPNCDPKRGRIVYRLYGIVEHSGGLNGGHYVAYVCRYRNCSPQTDRSLLSFMSSVDKGIVVPQMRTLIEEYDRHECGNHSIDEPIEEVGNDDKDCEREWFRISDSSVSSVNIKEVLNTQAYLLFYERLL